MWCDNYSGADFPSITMCFKADVTASVSACMCVSVSVYTRGGLGLVEGCHNEAWFGGTDVGIRRASAETWKWWFISMRISPFLFQPVCFIVFFCLYHCLSLPPSLWYDFLCPKPLTEAILPHSVAMVHFWLTFNDFTITARHTQRPVLAGDAG